MFNDYYKYNNLERISGFVGYALVYFGIWLFYQIKDRKSFWRSLMSIVVPLLIFHLISFLLIGVVQGKHFGFLYWITPYWTLWYLLSLVFWRIILEYSPRFLIERPWLYMSIAIVVSIFCGLMPHGEFLSIQRTLNFFPFFLAGFYLKQNKMITIRKRGLILVSLFIIVIVLALIVVFAPDHFQKAKVLLRGVDHYSIEDIPLKVCLLFRSFVLALSVFIVIPSIKFLCHIGKDSMLFYLYHGLIIKLILQPLVQYYHLPSTLPWIIGYWALVVGVIFLIGKIKPLRWLTNPLPTTKKAVTNK